jgi:hypothetical protein
MQTSLVHSMATLHVRHKGWSPLPQLSCRIEDLGSQLGMADNELEGVGCTDGHAKSLSRQALVGYQEFFVWMVVRINIIRECTLIHPIGRKYNALERERQRNGLMGVLRHTQPGPSPAPGRNVEGENADHSVASPIYPPILFCHDKEGLPNDIGVASPLACNGIPLLANAP